MIFPGFPGVLSFFQVFQVEWEPCVHNIHTCNGMHVDAVDTIELQGRF